MTEKRPATKTVVNFHISAGVVPLLHNTNEDTTLRGYKIPKDTIVTLNTYAIHMDERHWQNPQQFQPERFLNKDGKVYKPDAFVPFGIGRLDYYSFTDTCMHVIQATMS